MSIQRQAVMTVALVAVFGLGALALQGGRAEAGAGSAFGTRAAIHSPEGQSLGMVRLVQRGDEVLVLARLEGLTPGFHGFHIHTTGDCTPPDFTSAGGHWNPGGTDHSDHAGDFPSLLVTEDGQADLAFSTDRFRVSELDDADGSAIIVHQGRDNYANIPDRYLSTTEQVFGPDSVTLANGDAGARAGCGVIEN
jgi:Cu-Zn family superoxide dismutase